MDDADLYGDLYGADYDDTPADLGKFDTTEDTTEAQSEAPTKAPAQATAASTTPSAAVPIKTEPLKPAAPPTNPIPSAAASPPVGNSIATYSSRDGDSYSYGNNQQYGWQPQQNQRQTSASAPLPVQPPAQQINNDTQQVATFEGSREDPNGQTVRPSEMRDEGRKMFVGGLNWETTNESLINYFAQFGKVDACTIMRDGAGRSRGFAFLTFEDPAAVNKVMVREHFLDGKIIDPKRAIPRLEHQRTQKLFVGGLAPSVTAETLKSYFGQHGSVIDATVMVDRESGRSKGFGFVTFEDGNSLDHLLGHTVVLDGKVIEVKLAQPRHATQRTRDGEPAAGGGNPRPNNNFPGGNAVAAQGSSAGASATTGSGTSTPAFDAQAMANLYQRMMSVAQQGGFMPMGGMMGMGGMGMGGMGGMPMGGAMGGMGRGMGGMGMMGAGMGMGGAPGMGGMGGGMMGQGMGRGAPMMANNMGGGAGMSGPPRGPRAALGGQGPQGQQGPPGGGAGPMRSHHGRGQNTYHPYGR